jgi:hypothetical protein
MSLRNTVISSILGLSSLLTGLYAISESRPKQTIYQLSDTVTKKSVEVSLWGDELPPLVPNTTVSIKLVYPATNPWLLMMIAGGGLIGTVGLASLGIQHDSKNYPEYLAQQQIKARATRNKLEKTALEDNLSHEHEKELIEQAAPQPSMVQQLQQQALMNQLIVTQEIEQLQLEIQLAKLEKQKAKILGNSTNRRELPAVETSTEDSPKKP